MKSYFADTNVFLRLVLEDNRRFARKAKEYFLKARNDKIKLVFIPEIILEINYVLRKVYHLAREEVASHLSVLVKTPYLDIRNREVMIEAIELYFQLNIDLADIVLYLLAKEENAQVLSFDRDFKKLLSR